MKMSFKVINALLLLIDDSRTEVKISAISALGEGKCASSRVLDKILSLTEDPDEAIKIAAINALGRLHR